MRIINIVHLHEHSPLPQIIFLLGLLLLHAAGFLGLCTANQVHDNTTTFQVLGFGECADCNQNNFKTSQAFSGLHVTIDCKLKTGEMKRIGASYLDDQGKFKIPLPQDIILVQDGQKQLKHECYAQLHNAASMPCPAAYNDLPKIVFVSQANNKYTFAPSKPLKFSTVMCTSKFLWPHYKYPPHPWKKFKNLPKIPYAYPSHPWKKNIPKIPYPPYKKPFPPLMHKLPHLPKIHPKYFFKHPKYGFIPPKPAQP